MPLLIYLYLMIVFDRSNLDNLIVDHTKDNKNLYADDIEGDFDDYI